MKLREMMTPSPCTASPSESIDRVAQMMRDEDVGSIPIVENDRLVGIITDRDISVHVVAAGIDPKQARAGDTMTQNPVTGRPDMSDREALDLMGREQIRRLPIVENGRLVGMVALADFATEPEADEVDEAMEEISQPAR